MQFQWNEDTIRRYCDAEEQEGFYQAVAMAILPRLAGYKTLCDVGCGLGLVSLILSRYVERITCFDQDAAALRALAQTANERNIHNLEIVKGDAATLSGRWDVLLLSFFGHGLLTRLRTHCQKIFYVVNVHNEPALYPAAHRSYKKPTVAAEEVYLREQKIPYRLTYLTAPFGQPLTSMEEARAYVRSLAPRVDEEELAQFLVENLVPQDHARFPYYIPRLKEVGIFEIDGLLESS